MVAPTHWVCPSCGAWVPLSLTECPGCKHIHTGTPVVNNARTVGNRVPHWVRAVSVPTALLGIVAFFLPWVQVSCGPVSLAFSGYEMATGRADQKVEGGGQFWEHPLLQAAKVELEEGDRCAGTKLYSDAVKHYREAVRLAPNMAEAHNNLAWLYATSEDPRFRNPPAALKHARRAVELTCWKQVASVDTLAEAFYVNRDFRDAVTVEAKALQLEPHNRELKDHMGRYLKAAGMVEPPQNLDQRSSTEPQSEDRTQQAPTNPKRPDSLPLLWVVPGACVLLLLLGLFGVPRWPTLLIAVVASIYLGYFAVTTEQQLTNPQNTGGLLTHTWMWGFWGCWLGLVAPAVVAWLRPRRKT